MKTETILRLLSRDERRTLRTVCVVRKFSVSDYILEAVQQQLSRDWLPAGILRQRHEPETRRYMMARLTDFQRRRQRKAERSGLTSGGAR